MCIENESKGKYTCSHAPYTRFTRVEYVCQCPNDYHITDKCDTMVRVNASTLIGYILMIVHKCLQHSTSLFQSYMDNTLLNHK